MAKNRPAMLNAHPPQAVSLPVLIVDDEPHILTLLRDILEEEGLTVITASNGAAALYLIQRTPIALVLTDLMMPMVSGIELARHIHATAQTAHIPLLLMSAAMPQAPNPIFAAVIHKPFAIEAVVGVVRQFLPE